MTQISLKIECKFEKPFQFRLKAMREIWGKMPANQLMCRVMVGIICSSIKCHSYHLKLNESLKAISFPLKSRVQRFLHNSQELQLFPSSSHPMTLAEAHDSSSNHNRVWKSEYDVFLSFRGEDTRSGFTGHLYDALIRQGIKAFIDHECLTRGVKISPDLVKAIEGSRASIIVFSENYASSHWCLDELVKILDCMQLRGQLVLPVFYKIDPSMVRKQTGPYEKAMAEYENQWIYNDHKVTQWRSALHQAANLSGWHVEEFGYEFQFIQSIVENVSSRLNRQMLHVTAYPVGLESRTSQVISLLGLHEFNGDVRMVGIHGMGGIGKSTMARAVYNLIAPQFEGACFLSEVRETSSQRGGLVALQEKILGDILGGKNKMELGDVYNGISVIRQRLRDKKIFLILDDVNKLEQLQTLAGMLEWFGDGSRILITTRDKHVLTAHNVTNTYEVDLLNGVEALELFSWHAFRQRQPDSNFHDISMHVVHYAERLPLALKVIGEALVGRSMEEWEDALRKYESAPDGDIVQKLKLSYDDLDQREKRIFLDIACFFNGQDFNFIHRILKACDLNPTIGIRRLIERGLLTKIYNNLWMHSMTQEMGREIVQMESPSNVGERSRLWRHEDVIQVLADNTGTKAVEGIMLDLQDVAELEEIEWNGEGFKEMKNLRILIIRNACFSTAPTCLPNSLRLLHWEKYPSLSFPTPSFHPKKLAILEVPYSHLVLTEKPFKRLEALTEMNFSHCDLITKVPDLSEIPNLEILKLDGCRNLVRIHDSVGSLSKLVKLSTSMCTELSTLPQVLKLKKLAVLRLDLCPKLNRFPDIQERMESLQLFDLDGSGIEALPCSIKYLTTLKTLRVKNGTRMEFFPHTIAQMESLEYLVFRECPLIGKALSRWDESIEDFSTSSSSLLSLSLKPFDLNICYNISQLYLVDCNLLDEHLALIPKFFPLLQVLSLERNQFETIPECFRASQHLEFLNLDDCMKLQEFPNIVPDMPKLIKIRAINCAALSPGFVDFLLKMMVKRYQSLLGPISSPVEYHHAMCTKVPGRKVPEWFHHRSEGNTISFYARGKYFPRFLLCISFDVSGHCGFTPGANLVLSINENEKCIACIEYTAKDGRDHLWIFDPQEYHHRDREAYVRRNWDCACWNYVEVCLYFGWTSASVVIKEYGICFNSMEDIHFSLPAAGWKKRKREETDRE